MIKLVSMNDFNFVVFLNKAIKVKEEDESIMNNSINVLEFTKKFIENKFDSASKSLEEMKMKYDEVHALNEILEPEIKRLSHQNQEYSEQNGKY
jgi:hypothetical protein